MEIDPVVMVLLVILVIAFGIFAFSSMGSSGVSSNSGTGRIANTYPSQFGGGGCGR